MGVIFAPRKTALHQIAFSPEPEKTDHQKKDRCRIGKIERCWRLIGFIYDHLSDYGHYGRIDHSTKNPCQLDRSGHPHRWPEKQRDDLRLALTSKSKRGEEITIMMEGIRIALNEGVRSISRAVRLVRLPLFCFIGLLSVRLAFSAAQWIPTNLAAPAGSAASDHGATAVVVAEKTGNDELSSEIQSLKNKGRQISELKPIPNPSIGVEIIGGLALFLWVQRFRNSSV